MIKSLIDRTTVSQHHSMVLCTNGVNMGKIAGDYDTSNQLHDFEG